ncbi:MAG: PAS domain S-box protein [Actinomycetota bacterium]
MTINDHPSTILIVENQLNALGSLSNLLREHGYIIEQVNEQFILSNPPINPLPDLILIDILKFDENIKKICRQLKKREDSSEIAIIFLGVFNPLERLKVFEIGGDEYINKPFKNQELLARIQQRLNWKKCYKQLKIENTKLQETILENQLKISILEEASARPVIINDFDQENLKIKEQIKIIKSLYEVAATSQLSFDRRVRLLLAMGRRYFGLEIGMLARIQEANQYQILATDLSSSKSLIHPGDIFELEPIIDDASPQRHSTINLLTTPDRESPEPKFVLQAKTHVNIHVKVGGENYAILIFLNLNQQRLYQEAKDQEMLKFMAQWLGHEIERNQAKVALEKQIQRALLLSQITQEIRSSLQPEQIFKIATIQIGQAFGVSRCLIHTYISKPQPQIPLVAEYLQGDWSSLGNLLIPVVGNPHAELMIAQDQAISSPNVYSDSLLQMAQPLCSQIKLKSMLAIRTSYHGEPNGAICLHQCDRYRQWELEEIELLEAIAAQVGIATAQAKLLEQEKEQRLELDRQNQQLQTEISIRLHAEQALQESQRLIQAIADANPNLLYVYDLIEKRPIYTNQKISHILGYEPQELLALPSEEILNLLHPDDLEGVRQYYQQFYTAKNAEILESEYRVKHKNGEWHWLHSWATVFTRNAEGEPIQIIGNASDISTRKKAEEELRASQQRLSFLVQQTPLAMIEWNTNLEIIAWNPAAEKIFGYSASEIMGHNAMELLVAECLQAEINQVVTDLHGQRGRTHYINENLRKDGRIITCEWYNTAIIDDQGNVIGGAAVVVDITERKKAESRLQESAFRERAIARTLEKMRQTLDLETIFCNTTSELRQALNCDRVAIYHFHPDWSGSFVTESVTEGWVPLVEGNHTLLQLQATMLEEPTCRARQWSHPDHFVQDTYLQKTCGGIYNQSMTYRCVEDIYQKGFTDCYLHLLEQLQAKAYIIVPIFSGNKLWGLLASYQNSAPRQWSEAEINIAVHVGTQLGVAVQQAELFAHTQRQSAELRKAKEAAEVANRAKSQFLAAMSHELRTPLNAILGFSQVMTRDFSIQPEHREYLEIINRSGEHLLALINDVLSMSKIEAGQLTLSEECFDLTQFLTSIQEILQLKAQSKNLSFNLEKNNPLPCFIKSDAAKLRQVLINLLDNAIKFTEKGSVVWRIRVHPETLNQSSTCTLQFEIADTGPGISPSELPILFEPFVQTETGRKSMQGTGLGLPISQKFVQMLGGRIGVHSQLGQGTIFSFEIPVTLATEIDKQEPCPAQRIIGLEAGQPPYRILVVEDIIENRKLLLKLLGTVGFEVREAVNGEEAIALWSSWKPHLILMDMQMPVLDGNEATRQIKQAPEGEDTVIIALTASAFEEQQERILSAGCDDFMCKPFREEILFEKIASYLGVRYQYEAEPESTSTLLPALTNRLTVENLRVMPREWLKELHHAALCVDDFVILKLIEQIPESEVSLAQTLTHLVDNFRCDIIIDCTSVALGQFE